MMTAKDLGEQLDMIAGKTPALRAAGVIGLVTIGDVSFVVGDVANTATTTNEAGPPASALDDPDTFGGFIPQRRVPKPTVEDDATDD